MSSSYHRNTELRNVNSRDLYNLAVILDDDNYWQKLMEVIPQEINNQTFGAAKDLERISPGAAYERKYSNDHIRLIENAIRRPGESRLHSQILFDEWGSSGRKHERPTLGVLLHLLVQSKLYRAADFVAELLNEPKPLRPRNGPAAEFEFEADVFKDIQETVNDTRFYPNTDDLEENVNIDINKDYYTKYNKNIDKKIPKINDNTEESIMIGAPKPPPRLLKSAKLLKKQQRQQQILQQQQLNLLVQQTAIRYNGKNMDEFLKQPEQFNTQLNNESISSLSLASIANMPKLSELMNETSTTTKKFSMNNSMISDNLLPKLSALNNSSGKISQSYAEEYENGSINSTPLMINAKSNITEESERQYSDLNRIPIVVLSKPLNTDSRMVEQKSDNEGETYNDLPAVSALNLNGEKDYDKQQQHQHHQQGYNFKNDALKCSPYCSDDIDECAVNDDFNLSCTIANIESNETLSRHQQEAIEEDYNSTEHYEQDDEVEIEDDEYSIPNLSFLENRSSNNESSLTSVTDTSGENSFEQSVNDCSSTSADNVPFLSVFNQ